MKAKGDSKTVDGRGASQLSLVVNPTGSPKPSCKYLKDTIMAPVKMKTNDGSKLMIGRKSLIERQSEYKTSSRVNVNNNLERKFVSTQQLTNRQVSSKHVKVGKSNAQIRLNSTFSMESKSKPVGSEPEPHYLKIKRLEGEVASQKLKLKTLMERNALLDTELKSSKYQHDVHALKIGELTEELTQSKDLVNTLELEINQQRASFKVQEKYAENLVKDHMLEVQFHEEEKSELLVKVKNLEVENIAFKNELIEMQGKGTMVPCVER